MGRVKIAHSRTFNAKSILGFLKFGGEKNHSTQETTMFVDDLPLARLPIYMLRRPQPEDVPQNWEFIDYKVGDIDVGCYRAHAEGEPQSKITLFSGFKADMETYNTPQIRTLQRLGIEVDIILLPDPGPHIGYLHDNKEIVRQALTEMPPPEGLKEGIPNFIFGHSLGGRAFIANMLDEDFAQEIHDNYAGAVLIAPHFSSPYRSTPVLNALYNSYCKIFAKQAYGEAPLDWVFPATEKVRNFFSTGGKGELRDDFEEKSKLTASPITPQNTATTHGQILYSNQEGEKLWEKIQKNGAPDAAKDFPIVMLGGSKDFVSSKNHIMGVAKEFDADFYEFDTYHHPFLESKEARKAILLMMRVMTHDWTEINVPTEDALEEQERHHTGHTDHDLM